VLGELGLVGLALLAGAFVGVATVAIVRLTRLDDETRVLCAALLAVLAAYCVAAGVDWMWELTAVTVVVFICLALLAGAATLPRPRDAGVRLGMSRRGRRLVIGLIVGMAVVALASAGDELLGARTLQASQAATANNDLGRAFDDALDARDLQPWAASPYLQLALVAEERGQLRTAAAAITSAVDRAPDDWRLWLVRARIETKRGNVRSGLQALQQARLLNPRSPLFAGGA
jgi:tetratricopeptide (TPR) repeat protein